MNGRRRVDRPMVRRELGVARGSLVDLGRGFGRDFDGTWRRSGWVVRWTSNRPEVVWVVG